jgi:ubiquinone/menaquinone biosynthesis C-methylase UbiE
MFRIYNRTEIMTKVEHPTLPPGTTGLFLHQAALYDLTLWLMTLGRERAFRDNILRLAHVMPGEAVLDVGCGTGSLAIAASRHIGSAGTVNGIDASPEMLARAEKKARKAGAKISFTQAAAQALPFGNACFDLVLSTVMLHHLPRKARELCAGEMKRVLKPGGRVLVVDFAASAPVKNGLLGHFYRHGHVNLGDIVAILEGAGLKIVERGGVNFRNLEFVLATLPGPA